MADTIDRYGRGSKNKPPRIAGEPDGGPAARVRAFLASRADAKGKPLSGIRAAASRRRRLVAKGLDNLVPGTPGGPGSVNWTPIGPSVINGFESGRVMSIRVGPGGTRVYAAAANGGVWLSLDGGASWTPMDDYTTSPTVFGGSAEADSLATGALAVKFGPSDEVFIGTGEADQSYDSYDGVGIRHLSGGFWTLEASNLADSAVFEIVIDPDDPVPTHVFAATLSGIYSRPTSGSMTTWNNVTSPAFTNASGSATSLIVAGSGAVKKFYAAFRGDKVYSSPDGATWTALTGISTTGRIALAASESSPGVVYALCEDGKLYRLDGTSFWEVSGMPVYTDATGTYPALFRGSQGWYDIAIAVHPTDPNTVTMGGDQLSLFKGTITGAPGAYVFPFNSSNASAPWNDPTWVGANVHSDVHTIVYGLNVAGTAHDPNNVWVGSDGGLYQSNSGGGAGTYVSRNLGMAVTEFSYMAQRADTDAVVFAGAQDNGTPRLLGEQAGRETAGGDGGGTAYDPNNPYGVMRQYVASSLSSSTDGGATWSSIHFPPTTANTTAQNNAAAAESAQFVAPIAAIASGASTLAAFGTNRLWLTTDWGATWNTLPTNTNPYIPATPNASQDVLDSFGVRAISFASPTRIFAATGPFWAGSVGGGVWRFDQTGATWSMTQIDASSLPPHVFTALAPDNAAAGSFYITLGGGGVAHLYYWDGSAWHVAMPTTVVDAPAHAVCVDPANTNIVYVGTDVGCWKGVKSPGPSWSWTLFSQGLPEAAITNMAIHAPSRLLRAATHGRGVWEIDIDAATGLDPDIYVRVNYNDTGRIVSGSRQPWVENHADPTNVGYTLYHWMAADIKVRRSSLTGLPALSSPVNYYDFAANIGDYIDPTTQIETADASGTDRIFVEVHNRSLNAVPGAQVNVLLLVADASAGLPALPANYTSHINSVDASAGWLGPNWLFVDPLTPYRTLPGSLDVRTPQVVEYDFDFSSLGLPSTHDHVCLAAFVTNASDPITTTTASLDAATMADNNICHRNTHLVAVPPSPQTPRGGVQYRPQTILIDFHNAGRKQTSADFVFDSRLFPGRVAVALPGKIAFADKKTALAAFGVVPKAKFTGPLQRAAGSWFDAVKKFSSAKTSEVKVRKVPRAVDLRVQSRLARAAGLDMSQLLVPREVSAVSAIHGVTMAAGAKMTLAITLQMPAGAKPGDRYRFDVMQRNGNAIVGGSTYVIATT